MAEFDHKIISDTAQRYFNITPIEDETVRLTAYRDSSFQITDSESKKKYILQIKILEDYENQQLMDITNQIMKNAHEFSSKNERFSTLKIIETCEGQLSDSALVFLRDDHGVETRETNVKLFDFIPGETVSNTINNSIAFSKLDARDNLYRSLGFLCANVSDFFETQKKYLNDLASLRADHVYMTYPKDGMVSQVADLLYPDKSHPRRIIIERIFELFTTKKQKLDALPKRVLQGTLSPEVILFNSEKSQMNPNGKYEFKKLHLTIVDFHSIQTGPQCIELATLILSSILDENRVHHVIFDTMVNVPKLIIQGFKSHPSTIEFFRSGQFELLPSVTMLMLCDSVLNRQLCHERDPIDESYPEKIKHFWELLNFWHRCFNDDHKLLDIWSS